MSTTSEKIAEKKDKITKLKSRMAADQEKINLLMTEIGELESLEVKGMMKEYSLSVEDIRKLLLSRQTVQLSIENA